MYSEIFVKQRSYYKEGRTRSIEFRINNLLKLKKVLKSNEDKLIEALGLDLNKSYEEAYITEFLPFYDELKHTLKNLKKWSKTKRVKGSVLSPFTKYLVYKEPKGQVLIVSPYNYPIQLALIPLVSALAAGNTVMLKLSEFTVNSSNTLAEVLNGSFEEELLKVVSPSVEEFYDLFDQPYDHIFFTGSPKVGKSILAKAAEGLIPVTLELGGKSPCIIDETADLKLAARRITFGKLLNAGQTCIAPDYLLIEDKVCQEFLPFLKAEFTRAFKVLKSAGNYPKIISHNHYQRIMSYLENSDVYAGGSGVEEILEIEPAIVLVDDLNEAIMEDEIFGPVLPVICYDSYENMVSIVDRNKDPLALYVFSKDKVFVERIIKEIPFGGGGVNDVLIQLLSLNAPFGGRGKSGMGVYNGEYGFNTFSHFKTMASAPLWFDFKEKYPPYKRKMIDLVKRLVK